MKSIQLAVVSFLVASSAFADKVRYREPSEPGSDRDLSLKLQAGLVTYTGDAAALTSAGASYGALVGLDLFGAVDGELSYQGAAYGTDRDLPGLGSAIMENGGQGLVMFSPTIGAFEPYVFTGIGVSWLSVNEVRTAGLVQDATLFRVPLGVGVDWVPAGDGGGEVDFIVGARIKYDLTLDSGAFPTLPDRFDSNQLQTTLNLGATF